VDVPKLKKMGHNPRVAKALLYLRRRRRSFIIFFGVVMAS